MLNIFNLFLFLLALWILFMISAGNISWLYLLFGVLASGFISVSSYKVKLIEEKSELLYLSFGFYRHFVKLYFGNFFAALTLIIALAFRREPFKPAIHVVNFEHNNGFNTALLATSINMMTGLFCIGMRDDEIFIHAIDEDHFAELNLKKLISTLAQVNDDNLV